MEDKPIIGISYEIDEKTKNLFKIINLTISERKYII